MGTGRTARTLSAPLDVHPNGPLTECVPDLFLTRVFLAEIGNGNVTCPEVGHIVKHTLAPQTSASDAQTHGSERILGILLQEEGKGETNEALYPKGIPSAFEHRTFYGRKTIGSSRLVVLPSP